MKTGVTSDKIHKKQLLGFLFYKNIKFTTIIFEEYKFKQVIFVSNK